MEGYEPIILKDNEVILTNDEGNEDTFVIRSSTRIAGIEYLLAEKEDPDEGCMIFRMTEDGDDYILDPVTDESEFDYIAKVFMEQDEDIDTE